MRQLVSAVTLEWNTKVHIGSGKGDHSSFIAATIILFLSANTVGSTLARVGEGLTRRVVGAHFRIVVLKVERHEPGIGRVTCALDDGSRTLSLRSGEQPSTVILGSWLVSRRHEVPPTVAGTWKQRVAIPSRSERAVAGRARR